MNIFLDAFEYGIITTYHYEGGEFERSLLKISKAVRIDPYHYTIKCNMGCAFFEYGKYDKAICHYKIAAILEPYNTLAYWNWIEALETQQKYMEAVEFLSGSTEAFEKYSKAAEKVPKDIQIYIDWGRSLRQQGKFDETMSVYNKGCLVEPKNRELLHDCGVVLYEQKKFEESLLKYKEVIEVDPGAVFSYINSGLVLYHQGDKSSAVECYKKGAGFLNKKSREKFLKAVAQQISNIEDKIKDLDIESEVNFLKTKIEGMELIIRSFDQ